MKQLLKSYFDSFNAKDIDAMLACLSEDVAHHVNEGDIRHGRAAFASFCAHMDTSYDEVLSDITLFINDDETRGAAEYTVSGTYLKTDGDLPQAKGQSYRLQAGSFFDIADGKITRVTTRYNLSDWIKQVS